MSGIVYNEQMKAREMAQEVVHEIELSGGNISMLWEVLGDLISYSKQIAEVGIVKMDYIYDKYPDALAETRSTLR